jgi:hypothetical protein
MKRRIHLYMLHCLMIPLKKEADAEWRNKVSASPGLITDMYVVQYIQFKFMCNQRKVWSFTYHLLNHDFLRTNCMACVSQWKNISLKSRWFSRKLHDITLWHKMRHPCTSKQHDKCHAKNRIADHDRVWPISQTSTPPLPDPLTTCLSRIPWTTFFDLQGWEVWTKWRCYSCFMNVGWKWPRINGCGAIIHEDKSRSKGGGHQKFLLEHNRSIAGLIQNKFNKSYLFLALPHVLKANFTGEKEMRSQDCMDVIESCYQNTNRMFPFLHRSISVARPSSPAQFMFGRVKMSAD